MNTLSIENINQTETINSENEVVNQFEVSFLNEEKTIILEGKGSLRSLSPIH